MFYSGKDFKVKGEKKRIMDTLRSGRHNSFEHEKTLLKTHGLKPAQ